MREKMDLTELRERLKGKSAVTIARDTKLARQTVYNAMNDKCAKPTPATIKLLTDWLALDAKRDAAVQRVRKV